MEEEILTMAKVIAKPEAGEEAYLRTLCAAEEAQLRRKLKGPLEDQGMTAGGVDQPDDYYAGKGAGGAASWRAGDVSVQEQDGGKYGAVAKNLRLAAAALTEGLLMDDGFAFLGVRG